MKLIDTHCHPQMADYDNDRAEVIQRSLGSDIGLIAIGTTLADSLAGIRLAEEYADDPVYAAVGIHPTDDDIDDARVSDLEALLTQPKVVAIGETGLDYFHRKSGDDQQLQADLFEQQILLAQRANLPLIVHCRDRNGMFGAYDNVLTLLRRHQVSRFVMHCYSGDWAHADKFLELGGYLSFTGIITFPKSDMMQDVIKKTPLDRLMVETDAPFLAPVPHRGERNEPAYVESVAKSIADRRGVAIADIADATTENAISFFELKKDS
ncbi:MAG: TatD family hydrolase [Patescibacteria group bacterium]